MSAQIQSLDRVQRMLTHMVRADDPNTRLALSAMIRTELQQAYRGESANTDLEISNPNIIMDDD